MKRIYSLIFLTFLAVSAIAQSANLEATTIVRTWQGGNKLLLNGGPGTSPAPDTFITIVKNLGPDPLLSTDTIWFSGPYGILYGTLNANGLKKDSVITYVDVKSYQPTASGTSQTIANYQFCDSIWAERNGVLIADPFIMNNKSCATLEATFWATSVANVNNELQPMNLYPNPASGVVNFKYNFTTSTKATVVIRNVIGKVVYQKELGNNLVGQKQFALDINNLSAGIYMVELNANNKKVVERITVQ